MRLLTECSKCHRQYDASKLAVGRRFRCHCGTVLTVQEPRGHEADVVCCSNCGAPRKEGSLSCEYCGAEFTLHQRDLDTVCPHCLARVSRDSRYCHFCGTAIHPEMLAGEPSKLICPACGAGHLLVSRAWGNVSAMECGRCAGLWLSNDSLRGLTDKAAAEGMNVEHRDRSRFARPPESETPFSGSFRYRPCAECSELMARRQFGQRSGVIIDQCKDHGVWFDADELPRIIDWVRSGGLARANEEQLDEQQQKELLRPPAAFDRELGSGDPLDRRSPHGSGLASALEALVSTIFSR